MIDVGPQRGHAAVSFGGSAAESFQSDDLEVGIDLRIEGARTDWLVTF
jgi:hypothetical protein